MARNFFTSVRWFFKRVGRTLQSSLAWFNRRSKRSKAGLIAVVIFVVVGLILFGSANTTPLAEAPLPSVTLAPVFTLSGSGGGAEIFGTVRSITEATIFAENGGAVRTVRTELGASVPAGFIIAELENASERASVLSAEGAYEAALAARASLGATTADSVENGYRNAFISLETTVENDIDLFFGNPTSDGPKLLITADGSLFQKLPNLRHDLTIKMRQWRENLENGTSKSPETLLSEAESTLEFTSSLLLDLARAANGKNSGASATQITALASARAEVDGLLTTLSSVRNGLEANQTNGSAVSASEAQVKQALGALRLAQASLEKTLVRAPIGGTINFLSIRPGDFVAAFTHVATVSQNGALEVVANVSEESRSLLSVGAEAFIEGIYPAVITSISPALNPLTKQIEVHLAATGASDLVNGQSVRIALPGAKVSATEPRGPLMLPLASVKLQPDKRVIFTLGEDFRLVAVPVETGEVRGGRIEIVTELPNDLLIVADARGHADGEKVRVAESVAP